MGGSVGLRVLWISKASVTASYRKKIALLADAGVEIGVITGNEWGAWKFEPSSQDNTYIIYRQPQRLSGKNHLHWYPHVDRLIAEFSPDLIHIDEEHYSVVTYHLARLAVRRHVPFLFQSWQNIYKRYPFPFSAMQRYVFRHAATAIAGSEEVKDVLTRQDFAKRVEIVPLGVDTDIFFPTSADEARSHFGLKGRWAVGFVGRLVPEKGVMDLAQALIPLLRERPDWTWVVAGSGPVESDLRDKVGPLRVQVQFIPWLGTADMARLMNALDVLVVPSRTTPSWKEQFGRVIIEAMAVKLPVVAYDSGEIPRVLGDAGIVVQEGDIRGLSSALVALHQSPDLYVRLQTREFDRATHEFSQRQVAAKLLTLYRQVLSA